MPYFYFKLYFICSLFRTLSESATLVRGYFQVILFEKISGETQLENKTDIFSLIFLNNPDVTFHVSIVIILTVVKIRIIIFQHDTCNY